MKYFQLSEFACSHTGENEMCPTFLARLDTLRGRAGFPFVITSGYRDPSHPAEASKPNGPGTHAQGIAADIAVTAGNQRYWILKLALQMGFRGVGVGRDFVHIDDRASQPTSWVY